MSSGGVTTLPMQCLMSDSGFRMIEKPSFYYSVSCKTCNLTFLLSYLSFLIALILTQYHADVSCLMTSCEEIKKKKR